MRSLAEQLLDLSRLELAAIRLSPEPVRLRPKIEELVRSLVDGRPDAVTISVPPDLEAVVDPAALDRMLSNLVANSLRHGKPPVTITAVGGYAECEPKTRLYGRDGRADERVPV